MRDTICLLVGALLCERIARKAIPWDAFLAPHHRGWERAWTEVKRECEDWRTWSYVESSSRGHHFRRRTDDGGPNRWHMVPREADDFEPVEPEPA